MADPVAATADLLDDAAAQAAAATSAQRTLPFGLKVDLTKWNALSPRQKMGLYALMAFAVALMVGATLWVNQPEFGTLYNNLGDKESGQIIAALKAQNIPYKLSDNGRSILLPKEKVDEVRMSLAADGLPTGGLVGFEVMEKQKLGISQFAEQVNFQRALEGELSRTIQTLKPLSAARVHLAIPRQTAFLRDDEKPTASVAVVVKPGMYLDANQVNGIVHLVSQSVPNLLPQNVTIVDQDGEVLSREKPKKEATTLDEKQRKYIRELEEAAIKRVEDILLPIFGRGNVRAQATYDVDFSAIEQVAEIYTPNPPPDKAAVRSSQNWEHQTQNNPPAGVPGALTNQPPVAATAPITTPPAPNTPIGPPGDVNAGQITGGLAGAGGNILYSKGATVNYEVDKTVRHTRGAPGVVRRLSVAVVVNQRQKVNAQGQSEPVPMSAEELKSLTDLAREAVGIQPDRGDTLSVSVAPFVPEEMETAMPLWRDPAFLPFALELVKYLFLSFLALIFWFAVFRPVLKMFMPPPPPPEPTPEEIAAKEKAEAEAAKAAEEAAAAAAEAEEEEAQQEEEEQAYVRTFEIKLQEARELAKNDPKLVAEIIKEWMSGGEGK